MSSHKKCKKITKKNNSNADSACSLCGQLYNNFSFKGGYICEDCLKSIKDQDKKQATATRYDAEQDR